jgi:NADH-quinone oxidoreductase subunit G
MAKITIDGKEFECDAKSTVIEAATAQGIDIPHFCYHQKLSVAGNCRMCLVEVEKFPKLAIACATQVMDGMVVRTKSERVVKARNAVMEFLLINHPLDCPICDEAGECKLQDYSYKFSVGYSRFNENKTHKPKRVELGPHVMLDDERCIMCSRCVRFSEEIARQPALTFTQRGTHVTLTTFPGMQLDNPYAMNVIDLCPVGALTSREFRFKSRVWEMSNTESVCTSCARGCNIDVWVRNNEILRTTPRQNESVNSSWMCDNGRLNSWKHVNSDDRMQRPLLKRDGILHEADWNEAIAAAAIALKKFRKQEIAFIASPSLLNEDLYLLKKIANEIVGTTYIAIASNLEGQDDDLLIRADKSANAAGGKLIFDLTEEIDTVYRKIDEGIVKALYVLDEDIAADQRIAGLLGKLKLLIVQSHSLNSTTRIADIVLASSTLFEKNGTVTNFEGRVQRVRASVATVEQDRALDGLAMSRWDRFASHNDAWGKGNKRDARPSWHVLSSIGNAMGAKWKYSSSEEVFKELAEKNPAFKRMSYSAIGNHGMVTTAKALVGMSA